MKQIFLTGATSGFGELALALLCQHNHKVIAGIRGDASRLDAKFEPFLKSGQLRTVDLHLDQEASIQAAAGEVERQFGGKLDVLINNAGYGIFGPGHRILPAELRKQMEVNFFGTVELTRVLIDPLIRSSGRVLVVGSIAGLSGFPNFGAYNASKFALEGYFEALQYDLAPLGVQVAMIEPGGFRTKFQNNSNTTSGMEAASEQEKQWFRNHEEFLAKTAEKTMADPMRVARLIIRLSESNRIGFRNVVGHDAFVMNVMRKLFPDRVRLALMNFFFSKTIYKMS